MKRIVSGIILAVIACVGSGLSSRAQDPAPAPGSMLGLSADVSGAVSVTSVSPGGCPTRICSTNIVTYSHCYTNCYWKPVCATNPATGQIQCTNTLVCESRCYTNTFPQVTCTNEFLNPTTVTVRETLSGTIAENPACDQLAGLFPSNAVFTTTGSDRTLVRSRSSPAPTSWLMALCPASTARAVIAASSCARYAITLRARCTASSCRVVRCEAQDSRRPTPET